MGPYPFLGVLARLPPFPEEAQDFLFFAIVVLLAFFSCL